MVWSADADDAKMLPDIPFLMNCVIIGQLALNLVDIYLDNTLHISCELLLCLQKLGTLTAQKSPKFSL